MPNYPSAPTPPPLTHIIHTRYVPSSPHPLPLPLPSCALILSTPFSSHSFLCVSSFLSPLSFSSFIFRVLFFFPFPDSYFFVCRIPPSSSLPTSLSSFSSFSFPVLLLCLPSFPLSSLSSFSSIFSILLFLLPCLPFSLSFFFIFRLLYLSSPLASFSISLLYLPSPLYSSSLSSFFSSFFSIFPLLYLSRITLRPPLQFRRQGEE